MPAEKDNAAPDKPPLRLLLCVAATVAAVGGARYWEEATGLGYWAWLAGGTVPVVAGVLIHRKQEAAGLSGIPRGAALNRRDAAVTARQGSH